MKTFDVTDMPQLELQSYLQHVIAPRPIALVSTINIKGEVNLSPFSFFNLFSTNPPVCVFSPSRRVRDNTTKHTLENLQEVPECVIHVVTQHMVHQTSLSSTEYAQGVNEFEKAGFTQISSELVAPPRVAESPVHMECIVTNIIPLGEGPGAGNLVIAQIKRMHISEDILNDEGKGVDQQRLNLVARLGADWYADISAENLFKVAKPLTTQGIGIDKLPFAIRNSGILAKSELARLANVSQLPATKEVTEYMAAQPELTKHIEHFGSDTISLEQYTHQKASALISKGNITEAWLVLLAAKTNPSQIVDHL